MRTASSKAGTDTLGLRHAPHFCGGDEFEDSDVGRINLEFGWRPLVLGLASRTIAVGRFDPFAAPFGNDRHLRILAIASQSLDVRNGTPSAVAAGVPFACEETGRKNLEKIVRQSLIYSARTLSPAMGGLAPIGGQRGDGRQAQRERACSGW
jgi:hypothetical protein